MDPTAAISFMNEIYVYFRYSGGVERKVSTTIQGGAECACVCSQVCHLCSAVSLN